MNVISYKNSIFKSAYFYLLATLILFSIINPFLNDDRISNLIILILFIAIIFFCILSITGNKILTSITLGLAVCSFISYKMALITKPDETMNLTHYLINILFLGIITWSVIFSVAKHRQITANTLMGAICGYILIGFTWSFLYLTIAVLDPDSFSVHFKDTSIRQRIDHAIYFSFVTLTTTGYGDILAVKSVARTFTWLEAACGQIYLAVWISQLVGLRIVQDQKRKSHTGTQESKGT